MELGLVPPALVEAFGKGSARRGMATLKKETKSSAPSHDTLARRKRGLKGGEATDLDYTSPAD